MTNEFDEIRPYYDSEIPAAMQRMAADPLLHKVAEFLMPNTPFEEVQHLFRSIRTTEEFQKKIMYEAVYTVARKTTDGFTTDGFEHLDPNECYLFVANHRDIVLDASLLQIALVDHGMRTSEITFGSNLMKPQFVVDYGKSNKMFKVVRGANMRDFLTNSQLLSRYMRGKIERKEDSVWIAQRNGRTKNGIDATDQGIIKMFAMSGSGNVLESIESLHIVPVAISYQIEPCDSLKAHELYFSRKGPYVKSPMEDLNSIITGILQPKGKVHMQIMPCINERLKSLEKLTKNELYKGVAELIDEEISAGYKLYDNNYIAYDLLHQTNQYADKYTPEAKERFQVHQNKILALLPILNDEISTIFLEIYANALH